MNLFLDTNIVVDILTRRPGYSESLHILRLCEARFARGFVSTLTVVNVLYILRKYHPREQVKNSVQTLLAIVDAADVLKSDLQFAFSGPMNDFEDALQSSCARRIKADYIVTRNGRDFASSPVPFLSPQEFLRLVSG